MLAALGLVVATRRPRKPDSRESGMTSGGRTQIPRAKAKYFYECLEVCGISLLLLWPQLASLQDSSQRGASSPKIVITNSRVS